MTFAEELKKWRGKLLQKEAAEILKVPLDSYRAWEYGNREPYDALSKSEIQNRMAAYSDQSK